jgi:hypothetical protein
MNLSVYKDTGTGSTLICSSSSSGYTGVLICDITGYTGNLRAEAVRIASPPVIISQLLKSIKQTIIDVGGGSLTLFFGALLMIFLALAGSFSPVIAVILGVVALIPLMLMGSINMTVLAIVGILGGIIIYFITKG